MSISITSRNKGGLLLPSKLLYDFGKWVIDRFIHLFSLSFVRLCSLPNMIEKVNNAYITNKHDPPKLPNCHNVALFIIKRIGTRLNSVYCYRLSKQHQG